MKKSLCSFVIGLLPVIMISCKKDKQEENKLSGTWHLNSCLVSSGNGDQILRRDTLSVDTNAVIQFNADKTVSIKNSWYSSTGTYISEHNRIYTAPVLLLENLSLNFSTYSISASGALTISYQITTGAIWTVYTDVFRKIQ